MSVRTPRRPKASHAAQVRDFVDIPNIGSAMAGDFRQLGFTTPQQLCGQDPIALYDRLSTLTKCRQDPCVADTFIAAIRFMEGSPPLPWWHYTPERKRTFAALGRR
jgi:hypothetical protein